MNRDCRKAGRRLCLARDGAGKKHPSGSIRTRSSQPPLFAGDAEADGEALPGMGDAAGPSVDSTPSSSVVNSFAGSGETIIGEAETRSSPLSRISPSVVPQPVRSPKTSGKTIVFTIIFFDFIF